MQKAAKCLFIAHIRPRVPEEPHLIQQVVFLSILYYHQSYTTFLNHNRHMGIKIGRHAVQGEPAGHAEGVSTPGITLKVLTLSFCMPAALIKFSDP
jgi:hypothetical protein